MQFCSQHNPYAGDTIECSGNVHLVSILWEKAEGYSFDPTKPESAETVCDGHMQPFIALGQRDQFRYTIVDDEIIGEIAPQSIEGKPSGKEVENSLSQNHNCING